MRVKGVVTELNPFEWERVSHICRGTLSSYYHRILLSRVFRLRYDEVIVIRMGFLMGKGLLW